MSKHHKSKRKQKQKHAAKHTTIIERLAVPSQVPDAPPETKLTYRSEFEWWDAIRGEYRKVYATGCESDAAATAELVRLAIEDGWERPFWFSWWRNSPEKSPVKGGG